MSAVTCASVPRLTIVLAGLVVSVAGTAQARSRGRPAQCHIETAGKVKMGGTCVFISEESGSFTLANVDREKPLFGEILTVSASIVSPNMPKCAD